MRILLAFLLLLTLSTGSASAGEHFDDVRYNWNSMSCSNNPDGSSVSCGGQSMVCSHSRDGTDVSCGGESTTCATSRDGNKQSCGGWAANFDDGY